MAEHVGGMARRIKQELADEEQQHQLDRDGLDLWLAKERQAMALRRYVVGAFLERDVAIDLAITASVPVQVSRRAPARRKRASIEVASHEGWVLRDDSLSASHSGVWRESTTPPTYVFEGKLLTKEREVLAFAGSTLDTRPILRPLFLAEEPEFLVRLAIVKGLEVPSELQRPLA